MGTDTNDAGFESVYINAGVGQAGFSFNGSRLQWSSAVAFGVSGGGNEFLGWIGEIEFFPGEIMSLITFCSLRLGPWLATALLA